MISHFINTNKRKIIIIFFIIVSDLFSYRVLAMNEKKFYLSDKSGIILSECHANLCNIFLSKKNTEKQLLLKDWPVPSIKSLNKNLTELFFSCGSPCNNTIFYDSNRGLSLPFQYVVAVDSEKGIVVVAEENSLAAYNIFDTKRTLLFSIKRDWSPTVTLYTAIIKVKFIGNQLYIKYLEGKEYNLKKEVISI